MHEKLAGTFLQYKLQKESNTTETISGIETNTIED